MNEIRSMGILPKAPNSLPAIKPYPTNSEQRAKQKMDKVISEMNSRTK